MPELFGMSINEMPKGWVAIDAVLLIKGINESGQVRYVEMSTPQLSPIESLGMAVTFTDTMRTLIMRGINHTNP
jgi:hypothetical protein